MTIMEPGSRSASPTPAMERCEDPRLPDQLGRRCQAASPNPLLSCVGHRDHNSGFHYAFQKLKSGDDEVTVWWRWAR